MTLGVRGLYQVDQTVLVGVRVGHSPLLWALLGTVLEPPFISY